MKQEQGTKPKTVTYAHTHKIAASSRADSGGVAISCEDTGTGQAWSEQSLA